MLERVTLAYLIIAALLAAACFVVVRWRRRWVARRERMSGRGKSYGHQKR